MLPDPAEFTELPQMTDPQLRQFLLRVIDVIVWDGESVTIRLQ